MKRHEAVKTLLTVLGSGAVPALFALVDPDQDYLPPLGLRDLRQELLDAGDRRILRVVAHALAADIREKDASALVEEKVGT